MTQLSDLLKGFFPTDANGRINLFGFWLHTDDLLIIAILFLLYKEKVSDYFVYIVLVMLLLS